MKVGELIQKYREAAGLSVQDLADAIGKDRSTIYRYEKGEIEKLPSDLLVPVANALGVSPAQLIVSENNDDVHSFPKFDNYIPVKKKKIPLLGEVAAGQPIYADGHIEEYLPVNDDLRVDFALKIKGDSMINANIDDGDIVFIRQQSDVDDGQIAAVLIDDSATLKRVYHMQDFIQLQSENPKYPPMIFSSKNCDDVRILGLAVAVLGKIK